MRAISRIFAPLTGEEGDEAILKAAVLLARPFEAHISVVFFKIDPVTLITMGTGLGDVGIVIDAIEDQQKQAAQEGRKRFDDWRAAEDLSTEPMRGRCSASWNEIVGKEVSTVSRLGRLSDLIVVSQVGAIAGRAKTIFETALFETGRPVLLAPAEMRNPVLGTIIVAWNGSREAARVNVLAMPLLARAARVEVFTRPENSRPEAVPEDLISYLSDHEISAEHCPGSQDHAGDIGTELLDACASRPVGLLVMGAYTHTRFRELIFGGVTRQVLHSAVGIPILMGH